jgi:hypothetical protein
MRLLKDLGLNINIKKIKIMNDRADMEGVEEIEGVKITEGIK